MRKFATMTLDELKKELEAVQAEAKDLVEAEGKGDISAEDLEHLENLYAESDEIKRVMAIKQRIAEDREPRQRRAPAAVEPRRPATSPEPRRRGESVAATVRNPQDERTHGFQSMGHFARAVGMAMRNRDEASLNHLTAAATTYGTESVGGDGGWLVPPEFSDTVWKKINGVGSLLPLCASFQTSRNSFSFPKDETTPWDNSAGVTVYWEGEGGAGTEAKPKFEVETARLNKLMSLIKVTEELLEDAAGLDSYLRMWAPIKMQSRINTAIVRGNGVGKPLGILNAGGSLITVSKETSQDAATILYSNVNKMWSRLYSECRANAVWLINQECEPMLNGMAFVPAAFQPGGSTTSLTAYTPVYLPAGSIAGTPYGSIFGRPVIPMQPCSALGTLGDIILTDLSQYMSLTKTQDGGAPRVDTSIHLHFDQAIDTYRFIFRMTGQPLWSSTISPENGSTTYSWAVALETRS